MLVNRRRRRLHEPGAQAPRRAVRRRLPAQSRRARTPRPAAPSGGATDRPVRNPSPTGRSGPVRPDAADDRAGAPTQHRYRHGGRLGKCCGTIRHCASSRQDRRRPIFNAGEDGPVADYTLSHLLPAGLHGRFIAHLVRTRPVHAVLWHDPGAEPVGLAEISDQASEDLLLGR